MSRIAQLEKELSVANLAYQAGRPIMTDLEYDLLWQELRGLDSKSPALFPRSIEQSVGSVVTHLRPCLSLDKIMKPEEFLPFLTRFKGQVITMEPKFDGVMVRYYGGDKPRLVLSGDGQQGRDITGLFRSEQYNHLSGAIQDLEVVIPNRCWEPRLGANQRNVVAGYLSRESLTREEQDRLEIVSHEGHPYKEEVAISVFDPAIWQQKCFQFYLRYKDKYPLDGVVLKVKSPSLRMVAGHNNSFPHWAIAWKPPIQTAQTVVRAVRWQVSRNQKLIPVVEFEPLDLCGTLNRRATANNAQWLFTKGCGPGALIEVGKAGEIIPQILRVLTRGQITIPQTCPECGAVVNVLGLDLVCTGDNCMTALIKRISHFYSRSGLFVRGISESFFEAIFQEPTVRLTFNMKPWYLFVLTPMDPLFELLVEATNLDRVLNVIGAVEETKNSGHFDQADFLAALGLKGVGKRIAKLWLLCLSNQNLGRSFGNLTALTNINNHVSWILQGLKDLAWLKHVKAESHRTFSLTGTFSYPRNEIVLYMESLGWTYDEDVKKSTSVLFAAKDSMGVSGKWAAATRWGIQVLDEVALLRELKTVLKEKPFNDFIPGS